MYFVGEDSMIILSYKKSYTKFDISFDMRPQSKSGLLLFAYEANDYISITMNEGFLEARFLLINILFSLRS